MLREITIVPVLNGYVVTAGCQKLVFASREGMLEALDAFYKDPAATEKSYRNMALNKQLLSNQLTTACCDSAVTERAPAAPALGAFSRQL